MGYHHGLNHLERTWVETKNLRSKYSEFDFHLKRKMPLLFEQTFKWLTDGDFKWRFGL